MAEKILRIEGMGKHSGYITFRLLTYGVEVLIYGPRGGQQGYCRVYSKDLKDMVPLWLSRRFPELREKE